MIIIYGAVLREPAKNMKEFDEFLEKNKGPFLTAYKVTSFEQQNVALMTFVLNGTSDEVHKFGNEMGCMRALTIKTVAMENNE